MTAAPQKRRHGAATSVWVAALILWICVIWGNSLMPGNESSAESNFFVQLLSSVFDAFGVADIGLRGTIVRKTAHFLEHAILAVLATGALSRAFPEKRWWIAALCVCVAVPCVDETIQLFIPGRAGAAGDVAIDLCGCAAGALVAWLVRRAKGYSGDR